MITKSPLADAAALLRQFVQFPGIRCFNFDEMAAAQRALAVIDKTVNEDEKAISAP